MNNQQVRHTRSAIVSTRCKARLQSVLLLVATVGVILALPGCGAPKTSDRDLAIVDVDEARQLFERGGGLRLARTRQAAWIDPRAEAEFRKERIPGAILLPLDRAREDHRSLREYDVLIVYGNDFKSPRASALSKMLIELGHRDVRTLRGGLRAWKAAGHAVEGDER